MVDIVALATFLEQRLNTNSQGLVFRTYTFEKHLDKRYDDADPLNKIMFVPSIITTPMGSYLPLNDMQGSRLSFNLEILLPLTDKTKWLDMINAFVWSINGKVFYMAVDGSMSEIYAGGSTTLKFTCQVPSFGAITPENFDVLSNISEYLPISKTESYASINVPISLKTIIGFCVGDETKAYLGLENTYGTEWYSITAAQFALIPESATYTYHGGVIADTAALIAYLHSHGFSAIGSQANTAAARGYTITGFAVCVANPYHYLNQDYCKLKTMDFSVKNAKVPMTTQFVGETTGKTIITDNDSKFIATAYYERNTILRTVVQNIVNGTNQNAIYWLKIAMPEDTFYIKVNIFSNDLVMAIDDYDMLPLVFARPLVVV